MARPDNPAAPITRANRVKAARGLDAVLFDDPVDFSETPTVNGEPMGGADATARAAAGAAQDDADAALAAAAAAQTDADTANNALTTKADLVGGKVPAGQLPSYVDDVVEAANFAALPGTGETGKIYTTIDTGNIYRWSGSAYVELDPMTIPDASDVPNDSGVAGATVKDALDALGVGVAIAVKYATAGADIPSAPEINLQASAGEIVDVTGTTTITSAILNAGRRALVRFTGVLTLTHSEALALPGGDNIVTQYGACGLFVGLGSGNARLEFYMPPATAAGLAILTAADAAAQRTAMGAGTGNGSVTTVSVTTANGVSGSVANPTTTPAVTLTLGNITPSKVTAATGGDTVAGLIAQNGSNAINVMPTKMTIVSGINATALNFTTPTSPGRSCTVPDATTLIPIIPQLLTITGPTAARTITVPDANFTAARTDAANNFTGVQGLTLPDITTGITSPSATFNLLNATPTTINFAGNASTALNIGHASGTNTILGTTVLSNGQFTGSMKSTTALATPSALSATQATMFASTVSGAALMGYGTTGDVTLKNRAGVDVVTVGPNTTAVTFGGDVTLPANTVMTLTGSATLLYVGRVILNSTIVLERVSSSMEINNGTTGNRLSLLTLDATLSGKLVTTPVALAPALNAGAAVPVTATSIALAVNGVNALTLANGTNGQRLVIDCTAVTAAGTATLIPTTANGFTTVAFSAASHSLELEWHATGGWVIHSVRGASVA